MLIPFKLVIGSQDTCNLKRSIMINHEHNILCPYCGETINIVLDISVDEQEYIEDCFVCCQPILIHYRFQLGKITNIEILAEGEI